MATGTKEAYTRDAYIDNTYAVDTWIRYANDEGICINSICAKNTFVSSIEPDFEPRILLRLRIILVGLGVNNHYFILSISLILF